MKPFPVALAVIVIRRHPKAVPSPCVVFQVLHNGFLDLFGPYFRQVARGNGTELPGVIPRHVPEHNQVAEVTKLPTDSIRAICWT